MIQITEEMKQKILQLPLDTRVDLAFKRAFATVVAEHLQTGEPIITHRDGKMAFVPAAEFKDQVERDEKEFVTLVNSLKAPRQTNGLCNGARKDG